MRLQTPKRRSRGPEIVPPPAVRPLDPTAPPTNSATRALRRARRGSGQTQIFPRRRRPALYLRRGVLALLVGTSLVLLTISYRGGSNVLHGPQLVVLQAVSPIERGMSRAWQPVQGSVDWIGRLFTATGDNPKLRQRVDELEAQLAITKSVEAENDRLRDALALKQRGDFPDGYRRVMGRTIADPPTAIDRSFVIDLGTQDGVSINDPVMVTRGLVGRVVAVSRNSASVGLIINKAQAVSAAVVGTNGAGVLRAVSNEGSPVMELVYVSQRAEIEVGDLVVTSGWNSNSGDLKSIYPAGIPLGLVSSVGNSPADLYKTVQVTPFADFDRIDEVTVLVASQRTRELQDFDQPIAPKVGQNPSSLGTTATKPRRSNKAGA